MDPFSGSGTSVLTAALNGYSGIGLEVNPFFVFVTNTKLTNCNPHSIDKYLLQIITNIKNGAPSILEKFSTFSEAGKSDKWLFNRSVLRAFEGGWQASQALPLPIRNIIILGLIGAAMDVCNAEKDGKCLRYRKDWRFSKFGKIEFINAFEKRINDIKFDLKECPIISKSSQAFLGDSRKKQSWIPTGAKSQLCIMSPPYLNSFDYTDVYRPELFLGKFVKSQKELRELRLKTLRSHIQVNWPTPYEDNFGQHFSDTLIRVKERCDLLWDDRIPMMIQAYFEDLKRVFAILNQHMTRTAQVWIVVSTSAYAGVEIPVDLILVDICEKLGWQLKELSIIRYLRRISVQQWNQLSEAKDNKPHLRESLIILKR